MISEVMSSNSYICIHILQSFLLMIQRNGTTFFEILRHQQPLWVSTQTGIKRRSNIGTGVAPRTVHIDNQAIETVSRFTYLGSDIDSDGYSYPAASGRRRWPICWCCLDRGPGSFDVEDATTLSWSSAAVSEWVSDKTVTKHCSCLLRWQIVKSRFAFIVTG